MWEVVLFLCVRLFGIAIDVPEPSYFTDLLMAASKMRSSLVMLGVGMFASKRPLPYGPILRISCLFLLNISCLRLAYISLALEDGDAFNVMLLKCLTIEYIDQ